MAFLKLIRYKNLLMVLLTMVLTKYALLNSIFIQVPERDYQFIILTISILLITSGGYIINDIYDLEIDRVNKPDKVYIEYQISKKKAWNIYLIFSALGLILGLYLSFFESSKLNSLFFVIIIILLFVYSKYLKKINILGNLVVSFSVSLVIYITYIFTSQELFFSTSLNEFVVYKINHTDITSPIITYSLFAFLTTLIREIIKDIEDINGDLLLKAKTLPIIIGRKRASKVAFFFTSILLVFLLIVLQFLKRNHLFLGYGVIFILLPLLYFMYKLWSSETKKDFSKLSSLMKIIMFLGILSMLLFRYLDY